MTTTLIDKNPEILQEMIAEKIIDKAKKIIEKEGKVTMALPGGRSVSKIYEIFRKSEEDFWKKTHIFLVDERAVPTDDPESNFKLLMDSFASELIKKGILPKDNIHPLIIDKSLDDYGAHKYYEEIKKYGGFDIILLSSGQDCHVAALYPGHRYMGNDNPDYLFLNDSPKPPAKRTTASKRLIEKAILGIIIFNGPAKKEAYKMFCDENIEENNCPAKIVLKTKEAIIMSTENLD
jgi:6-phosphogluconolactonase